MKFKSARAQALRRALNSFARENETHLKRCLCTRADSSIRRPSKAAMCDRFIAESAIRVPQCQAGTSPYHLRIVGASRPVRWPLERELSDCKIRSACYSAQLTISPKMFVFLSKLRTRGERTHKHLERNRPALEIRMLSQTHPHEVQR